MQILLLSKLFVIKLLLQLVNLSKFLSFKDDIEFIFDISFILCCILFKLSNECFDIRPLFFSKDEVKTASPVGLAPEVHGNEAASSENINVLILLLRLKHWDDDCIGNDVDEDLICFFNGSRVVSILVVFLNKDDGKEGICLIFLLLLSLNDDMVVQI